MASNKQLSATITIGGAVASSLKSTFGIVKGQINQVGSALRDLERQQRKLGEGIQTFGRMGKNVDGMRERYSQMGQQIDRLRVANDRLLAVEKARTANMQKQSELRSKIGETAVIGAAIALPTFAAFKKASEFNYQLQVIGNTADMTDQQIKQMGSNLLRLSDQTGVSADTMRNAIGFLVAAGQDVGTAEANMRAIGRTATATASEIEDVARASFTLSDSLKVDPTQMQKALDILVQSGKEGNFEFKAMAQNLPALGASFQALKMQGTEAVATMGAALQIARKGAGDEAEAANNMKNFLAKILSPDTLNKADKLGSDLYKVISGAQAKGANPFDAAIQEIARITKGGDQKLLGELFADMQVQNFLRPMLQNLDEYKRVKDKALGADGVVDRDFARMMATSKEQTEALTDAFSGLGKVVGDAVTPVIGALANALTPVVRAARDFVENNPNLVGGVIAAAAAFTTLRLAVLGVRLGMAMFSGGALDVVGVVAKMQAGFALASGAMPAVAAGIRMIGTAFISTGIGALVAGLAIAGLEIYRNWDGVKAFLVGVFDGIRAGLQPVADTFTAFWEVLKPLHPIFDAIGAGLRSVWEWFTNLLEPVKYTSEELGKAGEAGRTFGEAMAAGINFMLTPLTTLISGITWVVNNIDAMTAKAIEFKNAVGNGIGGAWEGTKNFFGFGEEKPAAGSPATPALPNPGMATGRGGSSSYQDNSQNSIQVVQQPGENNKDLARRIAEEQERLRGVRQRSMMTDGVIAQ